MRVLTMGLFGLAAVGCATTSGKVKGPPGAMVKQYSQGGLAGHANCYWFETPAGAVIADVPLLPSDGKSMKSDMDHPYRIYITAAKPERFGSLDFMTKPDVPAYTTPAVATEIQNHGSPRLMML